MTVELTLTVKDLESKPYQMAIELAGTTRPIRIPFTLVPKGAALLKP